MDATILRDMFERLDNYTALMKAKIDMIDRRKLGKRMEGERKRHIVFRFREEGIREEYK